MYTRIVTGASTGPRIQSSVWISATLPGSGVMAMGVGGSKRSHTVLSTKLIQPDVLFIAKERRGIIGKANLHAGPDLIVEVLSPGTQEKDLRARRKLYAFFEVKEYWIVDPDAAAIEVLVWSELGYVSAGLYGRRERLCSPLLPGLDLPISRIFGAEQD